MALLLFSTIGLGFAACSGGSGTSAISETEAKSLCREWCEHEATCTPSGDSIDECTGECVGDIVGWMRTDVVENLIECQDDLGCGGSDEGCANLCTPTSTHEAFVKTCNKEMARCGGTLSDCMITNELCWIAPAIVSDIADCLALDCAAVESCIDDVATLHNLPH
ncbi:MAG: hypothetical protein AB7P03_21245 [Kofleriaceae bacterium]